MDKKNTYNRKGLFASKNAGTPSSFSGMPNSCWVPRQLLGSPAWIAALPTGEKGLGATAGHARNGEVGFDQLSCARNYQVSAPHPRQSAEALRRLRREAPGLRFGSSHGPPQDLLGLNVRSMGPDHQKQTRRQARKKAPG